MVSKYRDDIFDGFLLLTNGIKIRTKQMFRDNIFNGCSPCTKGGNFGAIFIKILTRQDKTRQDV